MCHVFIGTHTCGHKMRAVWLFCKEAQKRSTEAVQDPSTGGGGGGGSSSTPEPNEEHACEPAYKHTIPGNTGFGKCVDCRSNNEGEEEDSGWEDFVVAERKREDKGGEPEEEDPGKRFAGLEERLARFMNELSN